VFLRGRNEHESVNIYSCEEEVTASLPNIVVVIKFKETKWDV